MDEPTADEIASWSETGAPLALETVKAWIGSEDIELLGALYWRLTEAPAPLRIEPPLPLEEYETFLLRYLGLCLHGYPDSDWAQDRPSAGRLWGNVFRRHWRQAGGPSLQVEALKLWLADYYRAADSELRSTVIVMLLEPLFTDPEIAAYFSDWQADPTLLWAYEQGNIWGGLAPSPDPQLRT